MTDHDWVCFGVVTGTNKLSAPWRMKKLLKTEADQWSLEQLREEPLKAYQYLFFQFISFNKNCSILQRCFSTPEKKKEKQQQQQSNKICISA